MVEKRNQVLVDRADADDLALTLCAIKGIFHALDALVVEGVANEIWDDYTRRSAIDALVLAGRLLADGVTERY